MTKKVKPVSELSEEHFSVFAHLKKKVDLFGWSFLAVAIFSAGGLWFKVDSIGAHLENEKPMFKEIIDTSAAIRKDLNNYALRRMNFNSQNSTEVTMNLK